MSEGMDADVAAQLLRFAELTADFVGVAGPWGEIRYLNPAARKRLGVADTTDLTIADVFPADEFAFYYEIARPQLLRTGAWSGEVLVNVGGAAAVKMFVSTTATVGPGGTIDGLVVHAREVPNAQRPPVMGGSVVDEATGLLTRSEFEARVHSSLATPVRDGEMCAVVIVEIAGLADGTEFAAQLGAATILRSLAGRLKLVARTIDVGGRIGERHLGLLLGAVRSYGEASRIAQIVHAALVDPPITTAGGAVIPSVRCAAAVSKRGDDPTTLIDRAVAALTDEPAVVDAHRDFSSLAATRSEQSPSIDDLRVGLGRREVQPYAEPVVDLRTGGVVGYRGSARWHHRTLGAVESSAFVDLIADTALASNVDLHVAREMAAVLTLSAGPTRLRMYTPVSRRLIADVYAEQYLSEIADAFFLSTEQIRLQVARPLLDRWSPALHDATESLRDAGLAFALTDVEHRSDVDALAVQSFDEVHLARRLTAAAVTDADARVELSDIVRAARDRGIVIAARGVDTTEQRDLLVAIGCDLASGELFGRPAPADTID